MDNPRPQLRLEELQQLQWLLAAMLAAIAAISSIHLDLGAELWTAAVALTAIVVVVWPRLPSRVPGWVHRLAFPVIVTAFAYDLYAGRQPLPALVRLQLMLLGYRLLAYRRRRDDLQIVLLGLFLVILTGVLTVSPLFALQLVGFTAVALVLLLLTTLVDTRQREAPAAVPPGVVPAWAVELRWGRLFGRVGRAVDWRVGVLAAVLFAGVVTLSALLFMAIPRFELGSSLFLDRLLTKKSRTGFSENVRFGDVTSIQEDNAVAFTVDGGDASELPGVPYWRMVVLDQYRDGGFKMSAELKAELARIVVERSARAGGGLPMRRGEGSRWRFYYEPGVSRYLPLSGAFRELVFSRPVGFHQNRSLRLLALTSEPVELLGFEIAGLEMGATLADPGFAEREAGRGGRLPTPDYRRLDLAEPDRAALAAMAAEIDPSRTLPPAEFAARACAWLAERHRYSMQSALPAGAADPLVRWLLAKGPGHCEFFAGAFAALARVAGHPVRVVTGFKGGNWNAFSESLVVRNAFAHAWCELWDGEGAWIRVDPTPGSTPVGDPPADVAAAQRRDREIDSGWEARIDGLRVFWYRRVVNFDQDTQVELADGARRRLSDLVAWMRTVGESRVRDAVAWLREPWEGARVVPAAGAALAVLALLVFGWRRGRRWWWELGRRWRRGRGQDPVRLEAGRWLRRLGEAGIPGAAGERDVREALQRLRYGPAPFPRGAFATFEEARRLVRRRGRRSPAARPAKVTSARRSKE